MADGRLAVFAPFEFKDRIKQIPGRRWHPDLKCWSVPSLFEADARRIIDDANVSPPARTRGDVENALTALFRTIPASMRKPTHRALSKAWHPDHGGDAETMKALNRAATEAVPA